MLDPLLMHAGISEPLVWPPAERIKGADFTVTSSRLISPLRMCLYYILALLNHPNAHCPLKSTKLPQTEGLQITEKRTFSLSPRTLLLFLQAQSPRVLFIKRKCAKVTMSCKSIYSSRTVEGE